MQSNKPATIGGRIKELRERAGLAQRELAAKVQTSRETVNMWERGTRMIKGDDIAHIADALGTTCDYLLRGVSSSHIDIHKATALNDAAINTFKYADDKHRQRWAEVLNAIIVRPWILDALHAYLYLNIDRVAKWDEEVRASGGYKATDNYERRVALADSKQGETVDVDASVLDNALLLAVEGELRKLKEGLKNSTQKQ